MCMVSISKLQKSFHNVPNCGCLRQDLPGASSYFGVITAKVDWLSSCLTPSA